MIGIIQDRLFSHMVHCAHCGYAMFGQTNHGGARYYRHYHAHRNRPCPGPGIKTWLKADELEDVIMRHLFECFGNPKAVAKAIEEATPNRDRVNATLGRIERVEALIAEAKAGRERILRLVAKGSISEQDTENQLAILKKDQERFGTELVRLEQSVEHVPSPAKIRQAAESVANGVRQYRSARVKAKLHDLNSIIEAMTWDERRHLAETVFGGKTADGKRMGIYIEWPTRRSQSGATQSTGI